ncbi:TPA: type VI secretion system membrane subunit TssM [Pseudomonas aeruginosa]|nr:type VI secretion system membrane subunit TssM [Pseudomonas aeruginosa]
MLKIWSMMNRFGRPLLRWAKQGTPLLLVLGFLFLLVAIWWLGPQWKWKDYAPLATLTARVLATVILLVLPLMAWALHLRSRNRRLEAERRQDKQREIDPCLRYVQAQERTLDRTLATLRANLRGHNALYQLPWYLVLGQENSGKTSFINRSNQSFSLTGEIKAGSRRLLEDPDLAYSIDWWMGDEAVLIDPPGELISQPEEAVEAEVKSDGNVSPDGNEGTDEEAQREAASGGAAAAKRTAASSLTQKFLHGKKPELPPGTHARLWTHLIDWLSRNRSRRPLNGVVLMVDLVTLLGQSASDRKALAILLRSRLAELSRQLGTRPPLYVVLSKFDLLQGFEAFFSRLPKSVKEDIFGFTFTLDSVQNYDAWLSELAERYDELVTRLNDRIFDAMSAAVSLEEREGLFSLVRQLAGMRQVLLGFLADVLGSDRYVTPALPRGIYFSSVHQHGVLTNAFVSNASMSYRIEPPVSQAQPGGRSAVYFAQQLFQRVIYPEAGLATDNVKVLADKKRALMLSVGVASLGSVLVAAGWYHYYGVNRDKAVTVLERSRAFSANTIDSRADATGRNLLEPLNQIQSAVAVFGDYRDAWPVVSDMGLYQGRQIGPKVDEAYLKLLSQRFLPALAGGVMTHIDAPGTESDEQLAGLRVYRMIEDRPNRRSPFVEEWMARQWHTAFPGERGVQTSLMRHLEYAMKYADTDLPQYRSRVMELQRQLRQIPMPQRVYMSMRRQAGQALRNPLDLRNEIGPAYDVIYKPEGAGADAASVQANGKIDALLTAKGFRGYFEPHSQDLVELAIIDQWALGERQGIDYSEADKQALNERIRALYSRDYIDTWQRNLNHLEVRDFDDIAQAVNVLGSVTSPAAPLRRLVETVRDNSELAKAAEPAKAGKENDKTSSVAAKDDGQVLAAPEIGSIVRAFAPLTDLLTSNGNKPPYLDETMLAIGQVQDQVKAVHDSPNRGKAALGVVLDRFSLKGPDPIGNLQRIAAGLPQPLNRHVKKLADESSQVLLIEALAELERRWDTEVYRFYNERLLGRYPFTPTSREDVSLDDFAAFFGPQGKLQQFKQQYLKLFLEDNLEALYSERRGGYLVRTDVLQQLEAADRIRDAFFNSRGTLGLQFMVEPLGLTATRRSSVLNVDGQLIAYSHGASNATPLIWPNTLSGATGSGESRITLVNGSGNSSGLVYRGPWSMFRLLSQARLNGATGTTVDLSFTASDGGMRYRITAEKSDNPFTQQLFRGFALPRTLLMEGARQAASAPTDIQPTTVARR